MYPEAPETEFQLMSIRLEDDAVAVNPVGAAGTEEPGGEPQSSSQAIIENPITATRAIRFKIRVHADFEPPKTFGFCRKTAASMPQQVKHFIVFFIHNLTFVFIYINRYCQQRWRRPIACQKN